MTSMPANSQNITLVIRNACIPCPSTIMQHTVASQNKNSSQSMSWGTGSSQILLPAILHLMNRWVLMSLLFFTRCIVFKR